MKLQKRYGMWAASWHDGAAFFDPDPARAVAMAERDRIRRCGSAETAGSVEIKPVTIRRLVKGAA